MKILLNTFYFIGSILSLSVSAAPINWGPATDVFSATEVINSGTLIEAVNAGGSTSGSNVTVNGVLFAGTTALLGSDTDLDVFSGVTGDAAYNALLGSIDYAGASISAPPAPPIPAGLNPGDEYRLVFVTSTTRDATSTNIADYNAFVTTAADNNPDLDGISWTAIGSTATVDARDNTSTTGTGVPIYLLNGDMFASNYTALWIADIQNPLQIDESGNNSGDVGLWTGTRSNGTKETIPLGDSSGNVNYGSNRFYNDVTPASYWIERNFTAASSGNKPLYAISEVLTAPAPSASPVTSVSLEVGGGNLTVGTEYTVQVWYVNDYDSGYRTVGDGESSPNVVGLNSFGQFVTGTFVADGNTQALTIEAPAGAFNVAITAYQIRDRVTAEEMMGHFEDHLAGFPDYSWDKVSRWGYARKVAGAWTDKEIDILGSRCKYIWIQEPDSETERFLAAYPDNMYCFDSYVNLEKAYHNPDPFEPEFYLYTLNGTLSTYASGQYKYNMANPDCRRYWLDFLADCGYGDPVKSDVVFIDSIQKALNISYGDYYDYWGTPVSATYLETAVKPLLESLRDEFCEDFIIQGNFLRVNNLGYTPNANMDYVTNYITSAYLEGFESQSAMHETIEYVQQAVADHGMMVAPNFGLATSCTDTNAAREKASAAMPGFWSTLDASNQDWLACMYHNFDYKLAYFLIMAGEHSYMRCSNEVRVDGAGPELFRLVPPFPEFDRKLGAPLSDGVRISDSTWEREFEYCKVTLNVDEEAAYIDWSFRSDGQTENMAAGTPTEQSDQGGVLYQSDFTGADLASAGLIASSGAYGTWVLDTENDVLSGARTGGNPRANVYTAESWQYNYGLTLNVTFNQEISGARYSFGMVDADYTVSSSGDCFNSGLTGAYGIGYSATADSLIFNDGTQAITLSTGQGANTPGTLETMSITVTADSYSYSLNGAEPTTGSMTFDTSRAFRFVAHAQDVDEQYITNITVEAATASADWWEVDLEAIREIGNIDVWPGTNGFSDFYVLVSTDPFQTHDLDSTLAQPGVAAVFVEGVCGTPTSIPFDMAGRYARVQSTGTNDLDLADVEVWPGTPENNPPVAIAQSVSTGKNITKAITLSGFDVELEPLAASIDTLPSHGTVSLDGNVATYQPDAGYYGADSFTFKMMDASSTGTAAIVSITVESLLMAHWALDEGSGSVAADSSIYGRDATITNGTWVTGVMGNALAFNGANSTVTLPASTFSSLSDEITIAMWVYGDDTLPKANSAFYATDASGNRCLNIHLPWSTGVVYWDAGNTSYDRIEKLATPDQYKGAWNHWVFTKNAATGVMNIYHNGALWQTGAGNTNPIGTITSATIGSQGSTRFYDGAIDEVQVYKSALTAEEVYDLYMKLDTCTVANFTTGASNVLEWTALPSQVYHVYWSSNLLGGFTLVGSNVSNGVFIDTTYSAEPAGFYKLTAEPQP